MAILPSTLKEKLALAVTGDDGMVYSYTVSFNGDFCRFYETNLPLVIQLYQIIVVCAIDLTLTFQNFIASFLNEYFLQVSE